MSPFSGLTQSLGQYAGYLFMVYWALALLLHIALAIAVHQDGARRAEQGPPVLLAPPSIWTLATLLGGLLPAVAYWVVNASTLRPETPSA